jgi:hypothetical protein
VPAWKGEVVHPGAPGSQCVYRIRCHRILSVLSLLELSSNTPRYHKNARAYKGEPQFLERRSPSTNTQHAPVFAPGSLCKCGGGAPQGGGLCAGTNRANRHKAAERHRLVFVPTQAHLHGRTTGRCPAQLIRAPPPKKKPSLQRQLLQLALPRPCNI